MSESTQAGREAFVDLSHIPYAPHLIFRIQHNSGGDYDCEFSACRS
jgi:hypothetical protein